MPESRVGQLVRWHATKALTHVRTLHFDLNDEAKMLVGQVFGVISVETSQRHGDALTAYVEDAFIQGLSEAVRHLPDSPTQVQIFQRAISRVNHTIATLLDDDGLPIGPHQVTGAIVSRRGTDVAAAAWGHPSLMLIHQSGDEAKIYDLIMISRDEERVPHAIAAPAARGFSNLICGTLGTNDRLLLATRELREFIDEKKLTAAVVAHDAFSSVRVLHDLLSPLQPDISIAIVVSDAGAMPRNEMMLPAEAAEPAEAPQTAPAESAGTQKSIDALLATQARTEDILEPSIIGALLGRVRNTASAIPAAFRGLFGGQDETPSEPPADWRDRFLAEEKFREEAVIARQEKRRLASETGPAKGFMEAFWEDFNSSTATTDAEGEEVSLDAAANSAALSAARLKVPSAAQAHQTLWRRIAAATAGRAFSGFNSLNLLGRLAIVAILVLAVALNAGLAIAGARAKNVQAAKDFTVKSEDISRKLDAAESALIYRDDGRTGQIIADARAAAAALPAETDEHLTTKEKLIKHADEVRLAYRRASALPVPDIFASVAAQGAPVALSRLANATDATWTVSAAGDVFRAGDDGLLTKVYSGAPADAVLAVQSGSAMVIGNQGDPTTITADGTATVKPTAWGQSERAVADAAVYEGKIYLLDPPHNRILRLVPAGDGFGKPQPYLKDGTDVSDAVGLTIDGNVWVVTRQGEAIKLLRGIRKDFTFEPADPPVTGAAALVAGAESLFVLEPANSRILRYAKSDGRLEAQYASDALSQATGLAVSPDGKSFLVAVGNKILRFALVK